ncbi:OLC1v1014050C1 [Oldenlandia corymbosa var. corymbosa]|uniref:OLC1v1014050C1 n=1 Tax=Oldenlandia corymbosa var. corymbosa TaxID=529605 RepID=A0AAV1E1Y2_OLDCO|nr:OLC1v1014050C1 [Oldenlandia corymbosa var. corymbosa]
METNPTPSSAFPYQQSQGAIPTNPGGFASSLSSSSSSSSSSTPGSTSPGSIGPFFAVISVLAFLAVLSCFVGRICKGRSLKHSTGCLEWLRRKCCFCCATSNDRVFANKEMPAGQIESNDGKSVDPDAV